MHFPALGRVDPVQATLSDYLFPFTALDGQRGRVLVTYYAVKIVPHRLVSTPSRHAWQARLGILPFGHSPSSPGRSGLAFASFLCINSTNTCANPSLLIRRSDLHIIQTAVEENHILQCDYKQVVVGIWRNLMVQAHTAFFC